MAVTTVPTTSAGGASARSSPLMPGAGTVDASPGTRPSTTMGAGAAPDTSGCSVISRGHGRGTSQATYPR
jgi:hypothetical protein